MPAADFSRSLLYDQKDNVAKQITVAAVTGTPLKQQTSSSQMPTTRSRKNSSSEKLCSPTGRKNHSSAKGSSGGGGGGSVVVADSQQQLQSPNSLTGSNNKYKTEMCHSVKANNPCPYGENCQYAHSKDELRERQHGVNYKTVKCQSFYGPSGVCNYGEKCNFLHRCDDESGATTPSAPLVDDMAGLNITTYHHHHFGNASSRINVGGSDGDSPVPSSLSGCDSPNSRSADLSDDWSSLGSSASSMNTQHQNRFFFNTFPPIVAENSAGFYYNHTPTVYYGYPSRNSLNSSLMTTVDDRFIINDDNCTSYTGEKSSFFVKFHADFC